MKFIESIVALKLKLTDPSINVIKSSLAKTILVKFDWEKYSCVTDLIFCDSNLLTNVAL